MAKDQVIVNKTFSFDAAHQLVGHFGKCANLHGHTYRLDVKLIGVPRVVTSDDMYNQNSDAISDEGFVMDFYEVKQIVNSLIVDKMDHAFLARGDEPSLQAIQASGAKVVVLGFRSTVENMARYICWRLMRAGLPIYSIRMWETPTGWAEVFAKDIDFEKGPNYATSGGCDLD